MKRVKEIVKKLWPQRMRSQLILGIAVVHIVLMSLFVFDLIRKQRGFLKEQNRDQVRLLVSNLSANSGSFLLSNEYIGLGELVDAYDTLPNLRYAMVVSNDGIVLAHSDRSKLGLRLNDSISLRTKNLSGVHVLVENNSLVDIVAPVFNSFNKEILGWARIGMSQEYITRNLISTSRKGSVYILVALIIGSLFAIYIASRLSRGLYTLISASNKIKEGDHTVRVGSFKTKELSELGNAFNQMVYEISAKEKFMVKKNWEIKERVKELRCLYKLSELANGKYSVSEIMQECVNLILSAYQYPEIANASIIFGDQEFKSEGFIDSEWKQEANIRINGEQVGKVMVNYSKEMPKAEEGPFLSEERSLLNSVTEILGNALERMLGEKEILKLNRLYQFTSSINEMMLKSETDDFIYQQAVEIAIQHGKFKMAWIGNYDENLKRIEPFAFAGNEEGYLDSVNSSLQDDNLRNGTVARAINTKTHYYCNDIANDPNMITWREEALSRGYRSSISLPVIVNNEIVAIYSLYMSEPFFFNDPEIKMLRDVTDNIAFALDKLRLVELQKLEEKRINKAVNDAQENERQQISMELHDNVKQIMAASLLNLDFIKMNLDDRPATIESISTVKSYVHEAIDELRRISHRLAPSIDSSLDLEEKMQSLADSMTITSDIDVSFTFERLKDPIPDDIQLALYRILQEQISNILKYAKATVIEIELKKRGKDLVMNIRDNGEGFDPVAKKSGIGLENIRRRANVLNGEMKISSSPGNGCDLLVSIPGS